MCYTDMCYTDMCYTDTCCCKHKSCDDARCHQQAPFTPRNSNTRKDPLADPAHRAPVDTLIMAVTLPAENAGKQYRGAGLVLAVSFHSPTRDPWWADRSNAAT